MQNPILNSKLVSCFHDLFGSIAKHVSKRLAIFALCNSLFLLLVLYFANNLPLFTGENLDQMFITQKLCEKVGCGEESDYKDAFFVNVSYDKELVPVYQGPCIIGNTVVTNRKKLYEFLSILQESNQYKYVIMDLAFDRNDCTAYDDSLYLLMRNMDRLVLVDHDSIEIAREYLREKAALAEYYATITATNVVRYEYLRGDQRYIPTNIFEDLYPESTMSRYGWKWLSIYTSRDRLCNNSIFLTFDTSPFTEYKPSGDSILGFSGELEPIMQKVYYNLGSDLVDQICPEYTKEEFIQEKLHGTQGIKDKYIIVGNLTEDIHDTYAGQKPGALILYRALKSLEDGKNIVHWSDVLLWFIVFFFVTIFVTKQRSVLSYIPFIGKCKYRFVHYLSDIFTFSSVFFLVEVIHYMYSHQVFSLALPILYFTIIKLFVNYKNPVK